MSPATREWPSPNTFGTSTPAPTAIPGPVEPIPFDADIENILLLGSDRRTTSEFRTDILIVLSINLEAGGVALVSIPRDLYVYLPGFSMQRINAAYFYGEQYGYPGGGQGLLGDTVLYNLGIPIHHYASIEMAGFRSLVDTLGGVDVDVSCPYTDWRLKAPNLSPDEEENWALFTVPEGVVHMDGDYALWYARARSRSSDFDRSRRQHELLRAIYEQVLSLNLIPRLPSLYSDLTSLVTTDLQLSDLLDLALLAPRLDPSRVRSRFIGRDQVTSWKIPRSGTQVVLPNPEAIRALLLEAFDFERPDPLIPQTFPTVEVVNISSHPDWDSLAVDRLNYAGFPAHVGRAPGIVSPWTQLVDYGLASSEDQSRLLQAIGLGAGALVFENDPTTPFYFRLLVGDDYNPCFDPTRNQGN